MHRQKFLLWLLLITSVTASSGCNSSKKSSQAAGALPLPASTIAAQPVAAPTSADRKTAENLYADISRSVVLVFNPDAESLGSGVEIQKGIFVTNCHVLRGGNHFKIKRLGRVFPALLYRASTDRDICLLTAKDSESFPVAMRSSRTLKVGEHVYAIGNPEGLEQTFSEGIISQLRTLDPIDAPYVQTTAPISHGSSGGGLFDDDGKLIGIPSFMMREGQNLNFAAPIDWAIDLAGDTNEIASASADGESETEVESPIESAASLNTQAKELIKEGRAKDAIPLLDEALSVSNDDPELWGNLGYAYLRVGEYETARDKLEESISRAPEQAASWLNLGEAQAGLGARDLALVSVLRGYGYAKRKDAVKDGLRQAASNPNAEANWRVTAREALSQIDGGDDVPQQAPTNQGR